MWSSQFVHCLQSVVVYHGHQRVLLTLSCLQWCWSGLWSPVERCCQRKKGAWCGGSAVFFVVCFAAAVILENKLSSPGCLPSPSANVVAVWGFLSYPVLLLIQSLSIFSTRGFLSCRNNKNVINKLVKECSVGLKSKLFWMMTDTT